MNNNLAMEFAKYTKGQKIFITLNDNRNLEGIFISKSDKRYSVLLHKVSFVPSIGKTFEQLEFNFTEIQEVVCSEEMIPESKKTDELSCKSLESPLNALETENQKKFDGTVYEKVNEMVENHILIDQFDEKFAKAVKEIENLECIALHGEGSYEGRFGYLTILSLSTHNTVFLFDIIKLGSKAFTGAGSFLKRVLESNGYLKVVHNCALLSDCLKHKYCVRLRNVFDTQACHFIVMKNRSGQPPSSLLLGDLAALYLKLPPAVCEDQITDLDSWRRRPLEKVMVMAAAWRAAVIRKLKPRLDDALYAPFDGLCKLYLSSVRDCQDEMEVIKFVELQRKHGGFPQTLQSPSSSVED